MNSAIFVTLVNATEHSFLIRLISNHFQIGGKVDLRDGELDLATKSERWDCGTTSASYGMVQSQPGMGTGDVRGS